MPFPLPFDTTRTLNAFNGERANLGLWLDRFIFADREQDQWEYSLEAKKREGAPLALGACGVELIRQCSQRQLALFDSFRGRGFTVRDFRAAPDYRWAVGLGAEHVLETALCLHRVHGFPFIRGSAVKGVARGRAFWDVAEALGVGPVDADEADRRKTDHRPTPLQRLVKLLSEGDGQNSPRLLDELRNDSLCAALPGMRKLDQSLWLGVSADFSRVFGATGCRGRVTFFDAYAEAPPELKLDVLTPHYGEYYRGGATPPADYLNPVPSHFLTVAAGCPFRFAVAAADSTLADKAKAWLVAALAELGIGGKSAAGYGFFMEVP